MPNINTPLIKRIGLTLLGVLFITLVFLHRSPKSDILIKEIQTQVINTTDTNNNIAKAWDWDNFPEEDIRSSLDNLQNNSRNKTPYAIDVIALYDTLGQVTLDNNGNIVIDDKVREALERAFFSPQRRMDSDDLEKIQDLIRIELPGIAGEQTAQIVADYQRYQKAKHHLNATAAVTDTTSALYQFEQIVALREAHLGVELSQQLYGQEHANTKFLLDSMQIQADSSLSDNEKKYRQSQLLNNSDQQTFFVKPETKKNQHK